MSWRAGCKTVVLIYPKVSELFIIPFGYVSLHQWFTKCSAGPAASTPPGNLSEMQILMLIPDHVNQKLWVWDPEIFISTSTLGGSDAHQVWEPLFYTNN